MRNIPTDNLSYGLLITIQGGGSGSGYFINTDKRQYLVTAKHVLFDDSGNPRGNNINVLGYTEDIEQDDTIEFNFSLNDVLANNCLLENGKDDVVLIHWADKNEKGFGMRPEIKVIGTPTSGPIGVAFVGLKKLTNVLISNDVYIVGFPSSVGLKHIPQLDYKTPLVRRGIVAGKNKNLNTIILDCEVYPGNSGGPVVEVEHDKLNKYYRVIGTISQYIPFALSVKDGMNKDFGYALNNSGYSVIVPCDPVIDLINNYT